MAHFSDYCEGKHVYVHGTCKRTTAGIRLGVYVIQEQASQHKHQQLDDVPVKVSGSLITDSQF